VTRAIREQPRRVAAKLAIGLVTLLAAVAVGSALASDGGGASPNLHPRLEHSRQRLRDQSKQVERLAREVETLRRALQETTRRAHGRARVNQRLRRELQATRRNLARERSQ
jgi:chromosome segregation ATPase